MLAFRGFINSPIPEILKSKNLCNETLNKLPKNYYFEILVLKSGFKKTRVILKKPSPGGFYWGFLGFIRDFLDFTWNNIVGFKFYFKREQF